ncbi:MAG: hypothetical protein EKK45_13690 [Curvibacter sp.]|nr:MAG: hypothetical protein EKK45_13690 [Curvibacter sp.]
MENSFGAVENTQADAPASMGNSLAGLGDVVDIDHHVATAIAVVFDQLRSLLMVRNQPIDQSRLQAWCPAHIAIDGRRVQEVEVHC